MRKNCWAWWLVALVLGACHGSDDERGVVVPDAISAGVIAIEPAEIEVFEQVVGTVQPKLRATVSSKVTGRVLERLAIPGRLVKEGEVLVRIDTPQMEAMLMRVEAALANAESDAKRYRSLRDSGSVSQSEIERVETASRMARAERDQIRSQLDDATVKAPFAGRITSEDVDAGDLVQPGSALFQIEDPTHLRLEIHVAESLASGLKLADEFKLRVDSAEMELLGKVAEISPAADTGSRTFLVQLDLPDAAGLLAGQFGRAFLPRGSKQAVVVPEAALLTRGQLRFVAVVDDENMARLRIVRTGGTVEGGVEVLAGLVGGERIVAELPAGFRSGTPVEPVS